MGTSEIGHERSNTGACAAALSGTNASTPAASALVTRPTIPLVMRVSLVNSLGDHAGRRDSVVAPRRVPLPPPATDSPSLGNMLRRPAKWVHSAPTLPDSVRVLDGWGRHPCAF